MPSEGGSRAAPVAVEAAAAAEAEAAAEAAAAEAAVVPVVLIAGALRGWYGGVCGSRDGSAGSAGSDAP